MSGLEDQGKPPLEPRPLDPESTLELLTRARAGDRDATNAIFSRCLPPLKRWARGRLPGFARDLLDTDDLVQDTCQRTLGRLGTFEHRHQGALQAYLRQAVVNRIRDEVRRVTTRPGQVELNPDGHRARGASPLEEAIGSEAVERYERALSRLRAEDREAIVARVEMGYSFADVATALGKPSADSARMAVARALLKLAEQMGKPRRQAAEARDDAVDGRGAHG